MCISEQEYTRVIVLICKVIQPDFDLARAKETATGDWREDAGGASKMTYVQFYNAFFQLADLWCPNIDASEYAHFLHALLQRVTVRQVRRKSGQVLRHLPSHQRVFLKRSSTHASSPAAIAESKVSEAGAVKDDGAGEWHELVVFDDTPMEEGDVVSSEWATVDEVKTGGASLEEELASEHVGPVGGGGAGGASPHAGPEAGPAVDATSDAARAVAETDAAPLVAVAAPPTSSAAPPAAGETTVTSATATSPKKSPTLHDARSARFGDGGFGALHRSLRNLPSVAAVPRAAVQANDDGLVQATSAHGLVPERKLSNDPAAPGALVVEDTVAPLSAIAPPALRDLRAPTPSSSIVITDPASLGIDPRVEVESGALAARLSGLPGLAGDASSPVATSGPVQFQSPTGMPRGLGSRAGGAQVKKATTLKQLFLRRHQSLHLNSPKWQQNPAKDFFGEEEEEDATAATDSKQETQETAKPADGGDDAPAAAAPPPPVFEPQDPVDLDVQVTDHTPRVTSSLATPQTTACRCRFGLSARQVWAGPRCLGT